MTMSNEMKYQYTRAIRFKLNNSLKTGFYHPPENKKIELNDLLSKMETVENDIKKLLFFDGKIQKKLEVKKNWLLLHHKNEFIFNTKSNRSKKYKLSEINLNANDENYFKNSLDILLEDWTHHTSTLADASNRPEESLIRKSEIANAIRSLLNKHILGYLIDLLNNLSSSNDYLLDGKRDELKDKLCSIIEYLQFSETEYLATQSSGIECARASFNYFTVNKKNKEYFDGQIEATQKEQAEDYAKTTDNKLSGIHGKNNIIFDFKTEQEKQWLNLYLKKNDIDTTKSIKLTKQQTVTLLANFKSDQKSIFYEVLKHSLSNLKNTIYTNKNEKLSIGVSNISYRSIMNLSDLNNQFSLFSLPSESLFCSLKNDKNKKSFFFGKNAHCKKYSEYCDTFKIIAMENGQLTSRISNLEKQRLESQRATYWSMVHKQGESVKLLLIPRAQIMDSRKYIDGLQQVQDGNLFVLQSLTMRALEKLCFAEESTFVNDMDDELKSLQKKVKETVTEPESSEINIAYDNFIRQKADEQNQSFTTVKDINKKNEKQKKAELRGKIRAEKLANKLMVKLGFYKELLRSQYALNRIDLKHFDLSACMKAKDLPGFELELEKACYKFINYKMSEQEYDKFIQDFDIQVFDVTSYDLEGRNKLSDPKSEDRKFTKIWKQFWNNESNSEYGTVRLNPELRINYREADYNLKQFFEKKVFPEKFKHRRLKEQYTVTLSFALQAGNIYEDLSFVKPEDQIDKINQFNSQFREKMSYNTAWKYGVDVGQIELATLCLTRKTSQFYSVNNEIYCKYEFPEIEIYKLKDLNHHENYDTKTETNKTRYAIKNISYFIDQVELFEKYTTATIDLSTAKLIKGKIIANGDLISYLKLQKLVAKKRIYEIFHRDQIDYQDTMFIKLSDLKYDRKGIEETPDELHVSVIFKEQENTSQKEGRTVFSFRKEWGSVKGYTPTDIENSLKEYLSDIQTLNKQRKADKHLGKDVRRENLHTPTFEQINNLRQALVANMVGIICHLQETYPGYIFLEDLKKASVDNQFEQNNSHIARKLEFSLYKKFQTFGMVPPHVKDIVALREVIRKEDAKFNSQFGIMIFINEENTSKTCPYCRKKSRKDNVKKMQGHTFDCNPENGSASCGFTTSSMKKEFQFLKSIDNPDSLAAFNIASKIDDKDLSIRLSLPVRHGKR